MDIYLRVKTGERICCYHTDSDNTLISTYDMDKHYIYDRIRGKISLGLIFQHALTKAWKEKKLLNQLKTNIKVDVLTRKIWVLWSSGAPLIAKMEDPHNILQMLAVISNYRSNKDK